LPRRTPPLPNVGLEKAREAAAAVGGVVIAPKFDPADKSTDYNDLRVTQGEAATRKAIERAFADVGITELLPAANPARTQQRSDVMSDRVERSKERQAHTAHITEAQRQAARQA
jgi:phage/plasmid primase-like uncharacterized protein